jgi:hypothetical protein
VNDPVRIVIHGVEHPPPLAQQLAQVGIALMRCYSCGTIMERGTQCRNCGAWCR